MKPQLGPFPGQGPGKQKPSTLLLLLPCCFPHGNTPPSDLGPPLHYGEAQESLPGWGHIECSRRNVPSIKNSSRAAASALTRAQTGPGRQQENGTCEEAQKEETNTNNRLDAEISRKIPAESVTRTQATVHTPRGAEGYTNHDVRVHTHAKTHAVCGGGFMDATCPHGIR